MKNRIRIGVGIAALISAAALANAQTERPSPRGGANYEFQALGQDRATEIQAPLQGAEPRAIPGGPRTNTGQALEGRPGRAGHNGYAVNGGLEQGQHPTAQRPYAQHPFAQHPYGPQRPAQPGLQGRAPMHQGTATPAQPSARGALEKQTLDQSREQIPGELESQGPAMISPDQEARIRDRVRNESSACADHADFGLSVGSVVPRGERLAILPDDAVSIAPRFKGYKFVIVEDEIVIIDPRSYRVAAVIPETGGPGFEPAGPGPERAGPGPEPIAPGEEPVGPAPEPSGSVPGCRRC